MPYIYRLLNKDNDILYIGYSTVLANRIKSHLQGQGVAKEAVEQVTKVEYMNAPIKKGKNLEQYLINLYKPKYNFTTFPPDMEGVSKAEDWMFYCYVVNGECIDTVDIGYEPKPVVKQVSFKKNEVYLLEALEKRYRPLSFSNYVKGLIIKDLAETSNKHYEADKSLKEEVKEVKEEVKEIEYDLDAEREDISI